ncbi:MAG: DUF5103 domain-containing protein [Prolixibacteraceae bacterium]
MKTVKFILLVLFLCSCSLLRLAGQPVYNAGLQFFTDPNIHTVLFFTEGWEFSQPVLELGTARRLTLKFDDLTRNPKNYNYTIIHCDADWNPSRIVSSEYMAGFPENPINDYAFAINTTIPFVNYRLMLPNENIRILVSGNYLLKVWENGNKDKPVIVRPFYVTEKQIDISGEIRQASFEGFSGASQQISFAANYQSGSQGLVIPDPLNEIKVVVMQNSRWENRLIGLKPTFIRQNQLVYEEKTNLFKGGNEFRNFNAKNLQANGMGIQGIEYRDPYYHVFLVRDASLRREIYRTRDDLNGRYLVKNDRAGDSDLESDYIWVHFAYTPDNMVTNDLIFVFGALSDWQCSPINQMTWNPETKLYEAAILLKQGFYDYQYAVVDRRTMTIDATQLEGTHVETENDYHFFVYYRGFSSRYDRLVGYRVINSVKR